MEARFLRPEQIAGERGSPEWKLSLKPPYLDGDDPTRPSMAIDHALLGKLADQRLARQRMWSRLYDT